MRSGHIQSLAAAVLLLAASGCQGRAQVGGAASAVRKQSSRSQSVFDDITLDTYTPSAASPEVDDEFLGIRIAMPEEVSLDEAERIPLCGVWIISDEMADGAGNLDENFVYLIRNVRTHQSFTGHFRYHVHPPDPEPPEGEERENEMADDLDEPEFLEGETTNDEPVDTNDYIELDTSIVQGWFNYNLGRVWKAKPGRYRLNVIVGSVQSNSVEFEVVE